ncbi:MAG: hypothetical protein IJX17_02150 [Clostridia bacterium]|nr:hypothetical protein [Clostridia bacterium]
MNEVQNMLQRSGIYVDITKIITAYDKSLEVEKDDIFCVQDPSSKEDKKFSVTKYMEARKLYDSGELQSEIRELAKKISQHRYIISKNREKDRESLEFLRSKSEKIRSCICYIDTKKEWNNIISDSYPNRNTGSYLHSLNHFVDIYKNLADTMEKTCQRHLGDKHFAEKLNDMLEADMKKTDVTADQGREDYQFALKTRSKFVGVLQKYQDRYLENSNDLSSEQSSKWL